MQFNVPLRRKDKEIETTPCVVEKTIELNGSEYACFCQNLLDDYDFLSENRESMYVDAEGVSHCLLVLGEGSKDGILVESEGSSYARYSAYVPHARTLMQMDQYLVLQEINNQTMRNEDNHVKQAAESQEDGACRLSLKDIQWDLQFLAAMLEKHSKVSDMNDSDKEFVSRMSSEYLPAEETQRTRISQEQADLMCARHTLWLHDEGGAQADFSGCELADLDLSHRCLDSALFTGAFICGTDFDQSQLNGADFTSASFYDCTARGISTEGAVFKETVLEDCSLKGAVITHSNFAGAKLLHTALTDARLQDCCIEGTVFERTDIEQADMQDCSNDEQDWSEDSGPVLSM